MGDLTNKVYSLQCAVGKPRYQMEIRLKGAGENRLKLANIGTFIDTTLVGKSGLEGQNAISNLKKKIEDRNDMIYNVVRSPGFAGDEMAAGEDGKRFDSSC